MDVVNDRGHKDKHSRLFALIGVNIFLNILCISFQTDHVMLVGEGANLFASKMGIPEVPKEELVTQEAIKDWEHYHKFKITVEDLFSNR